MIMKDSASTQDVEEIDDSYKWGHGKYDILNKLNDRFIINLIKN